MHLHSHCNRGLSPSSNQQSFFVLCQPIKIGPGVVTRGKALEPVAQLRTTPSLSRRQAGRLLQDDYYAGGSTVL